MRIYKEEIKGQYSKTPIEYLKESSLTMKEKAMLAVLYALPQEWDLSIEGLAKIMADGTTGIRTTFRNLIKKGYLRQFRTRGSNGCFNEWDLYLNIHPVPPDMPSDGNPHMAYPLMGKADMAQLHEVSRRESINKEFMNKESRLQTRNYPARTRSKNSFNNFRQREYDYPTLEMQLLKSQGMTVPADGSSEQAGTDK